MPLVVAGPRKQLQSTVQRARDYALEALKWMQEDGLVTSVG